MTERKTAGELARKASQDTTDYNVMEVAHAMCEDIEEELWKSIAIYKDMIDEPEFCVVRVIASDPLIKGVKRFKYYCWPYLPSPRPDQTVFLYNKELDSITKRLWSLPNAARMAQLASTSVFVPKEYQTMQAWSVAFFKGTFWEFVRHDQNINMPSEHEFFLSNREKLIQAGCQIPKPGISDAFDFSKVAVEKIVDTKTSMGNQDTFSGLCQA